MIWKIYNSKISMLWVEIKIPQKNWILRVNLYLDLNLYTSVGESRTVNQTKYIHTCWIYVTHRDVYNTL